MRLCLYCGKPQDHHRGMDADTYYCQAHETEVTGSQFTPLPTLTPEGGWSYEGSLDRWDIFTDLPPDLARDLGYSALRIFYIRDDHPEYDVCAWEDGDDARKPVPLPLKQHALDSLPPIPGLCLKCGKPRNKHKMRHPKYPDVEAPGHYCDDGSGDQYMHTKRFSLAQLQSVGLEPRYRLNPPTPGCTPDFQFRGRDFTLNVWKDGEKEGELVFQYGGGNIFVKDYEHLKDLARVIAKGHDRPAEATTVAITVVGLNLPIDRAQGVITDAIKKTPGMTPVTPASLMRNHGEPTHRSYGTYAETTLTPNPRALAQAMRKHLNGEGSVKVTITTVTSRPQTYTYDEAEQGYLY